MRSKEIFEKSYYELEYILILDFMVPQRNTYIHNSIDTSIYTKFGRNRPIVSIDGYDETVHRGLFRLSHSRRIMMNGHDLIKGNAL